MPSVKVLMLFITKTGNTELICSTCDFAKGLFKYYVSIFFKHRQNSESGGHYNWLWPNPTTSLGSQDLLFTVGGHNDCLLSKMIT